MTLPRKNKLSFSAAMGLLILYIQFLVVRIKMKLFQCITVKKINTATYSWHRKKLKGTIRGHRKEKNK